MRRKIMLVSSVLLCAVGLCGCGGGSGGKRVKTEYLTPMKAFTVGSYDFYGRTQVLYCGVDCVDLRLGVYFDKYHGDDIRVANPNPLKRVGYDFAGVFTADGQQVFDSNGMRAVGITDSFLADYRGKINAEWNAKMGYTIHFEGGDCTGVNDITGLTYDQTIEALPVPVPNDPALRFDGWYCDADFRYPTTDKTGTPLYGRTNAATEEDAKKDRNYNFGSAYKFSNGFVDNRIFNELNNYEFCEYTPYTPSPNYKPAAWGEELESKVVTLYAKYVPNEFEVTFDYGDEHGDRQPVKTVALKGDELADLAEELDDVTDGEYGIAEWTHEDGTSLEEGETVAGDTTLKAVWKKFRTVAMRSDGFENRNLRVFDGSYVYPDTLLPEREGYELDGFYISPSFTGMPVEALTYDGTVSAIYAKWNPIEYTIEYITTGTLVDSISVPSATYTADSATFDLFKFGSDTPQNYIHTGWVDINDDADEPEVLTKIEKGSMGHLTLIPCFKGKEVTIQLDHRITSEMQYAAAANKRPASVKVEYGKEFTIPPVENFGYQFIGWFTAAEGGEQITDGDGLSFGICEFAATTKLYAHWVEGDRVITVTYLIDIDTSYTKKNESGKTLDLSPPPEESGKRFVGWFSSTGAQYREGDVVYDDITLFAKFEDEEGAR